MAVTMPLLTTVVPLAPKPLPPTNCTCGTDEYSEPPLVIMTPLTHPHCCVVLLAGNVPRTAVKATVSAPVQPLSFSAGMFAVVCTEARMISAAEKSGKRVGKLGTAGGELGTVLRDWGRRSENCAAEGSRLAWAVKFLRSGRDVAARWLSIRLPTFPRMLMECGQNF